MVSKLSWDNTSILVDKSEVLSDQIKKMYNEVCKEDCIGEEANNISFYNSEDIHFLEAEFILQARYIRDIIDKLKEKKKKKSSHFFDYKSFKVNKINSSDAFGFSEYQKMISNNLIESGFTRDEFISPNYFYCLKDNYIKSGYDINSKEIYVLNFFCELFALIALADNITLNNSNEEPFKFIIQGEAGEKVEKIIGFGDWAQLQETNFYIAYEWIHDNSEDKIKKSTKLNIVRNYIKKRQSFNLPEDCKYAFNTIVENIVKEETDKFFNHQSKIKDEFVELTKISFEAHQSLFKITVGVLISIGIAYYGLVISEEQFDVMKRDYRLGIVFSFGLVGLLFSFLIFFREIGEIQSLYDKLKKVYVDQFGFSKKQFESFIKRPRFWCDNKLILSSIVILALIFAFLILFHFDIDIC